MEESIATGSTDSEATAAVPIRTKPAYRALLLDAEGKVLGIEALFARSDAEALALAHAMAWASSVEVWDGLRFVDGIPAADRTASPRCDQLDQSEGILPGA